MSEDLSAWLNETGAQGDPTKYRKTDLEMWAKRLFDRFKFRAGNSDKERRRSFEEIWDAAGGNSEAIAYGFNSSLTSKIYSVAYIKACIKNFFISPSVPKTPIQIVLQSRGLPINPVHSVVKPSKVQKKAKPSVPPEPVPDVKWK